MSKLTPEPDSTGGGKKKTHFPCFGDGHGHDPLILIVLYKKYAFICRKKIIILIFLTKL
jgi:hypothetical protein